MARPPLPLGTAGAVKVQRHPERKGMEYQAYCQFRDLDGKTRQVERWGKSESAAKRRLSEACRDRIPPGSVALTGRSRFAEAAAMWITSIEQRRKPRTVATYRWALKCHVLPALGDLRLMECRAIRLNGYFAELAALGYSGHTRRTIRSVVSGVLNEGLAAEVYLENPVRSMRRIEGAKRSKVRALAPDERRTLLGRLDDLRCRRHLQAEHEVAARCLMCGRQRRNIPDLTRFMLGTGVRISECLAVRWCDLDLDVTPGRVRVGPTIVRIPGRGLVRQDEEFWGDDPGKSPAAVREIVLPEFVVAMLLARRPADAADTDPVFPSASHTWWDPSNAQDALRTARERCGFDWLTSHVFRKTAATILDDAGFSPRHVADQLGHEKPSITLDSYLGRGTLNPAAAAALDDAYRPADAGGPGTDSPAGPA